MLYVCELIFLFEQVIKNYPTLGKLDFVNLDNVVLEIKNKIELFNKLNNIYFFELDNNEGFYNFIKKYKSNFGILEYFGLSK